MRRSARILTYGAALAIVAGGTLAWTRIDKTVGFDVDGQHRTVRTTGNRVSDALSAAGYRVGPHDILAPAAGSRIHDGSQVVLRRGRLLHLTIDGQAQAVWTTEPTVDAALAVLGYPTADFTSVSRGRRLPLTPTDIEIRRPKHVTIRHDGTATPVVSTAPTVSLALSTAGVAVGALDRVTPAVATGLADGQQIVVQRVRQQQVVETAPIPIRTQQRNDDSLEVGTTTVITPGTAGVEQRTYAVVYVDGVPSGRTLVGTSVAQPAVDRVLRIGTKAVTPQQIAAQLVAAHGWSTDQMSCLTLLWNHESGWRIDATNASSGAYGIPQALPGNKMATAGPNWQTDARTQITWGLDYIAGVYGTPCGAWNHELDVNWY